MADLADMIGPDALWLIQQEMEQRRKRPSAFVVDTSVFFWETPTLDAVCLQGVGTAFGGLYYQAGEVVPDKGYMTLERVQRRKVWK